MLDLKFIRENPDTGAAGTGKPPDSAPLDEILELDTERRQKIRELEDLRQARKDSLAAKGKMPRKRAATCAP